MVVTLDGFRGRKHVRAGRLKRHIDDTVYVSPLVIVAVASVVEDLAPLAGTEPDGAAMGTSWCSAGPDELDAKPARFFTELDRLDERPSPREVQDLARFARYEVLRFLDANEVNEYVFRAYRWPGNQQHGW